MTDRVNPAIVSFLAGCQSGERLRFMDARHPREQAHILARPNKSPGFKMSDMTILSTKAGGSCWQVSVDSVGLLPSCLQFQLMKEKESFEIRKRLLWEMKLIDWPKYSWCSAKESSVLSKRIVDSKQKNRRC